MSHFADPRTEWRISDLEQSLNRKADNYEVSTLVGNVDRLEYSSRETSAEIIELRSQLQMLTDQVASLTDQVASLTDQVITMTESKS